MTKDEALTVALQQIEVAVEYIDHLGGESGMYRAALVGLKKALAQQDAEAHLQAVSDFGQLQEQEPVAWHTEDHLTDRSATTYRKDMVYSWECKGWPVTPLFTSPPKRQLESTTDMMMELADRLGGLPDDIDPRAWGHLLVYAPKKQWVSLTEWEREAISVECGAMSADWLIFVEAVEKALKEKNT